MTLDLPPLVEAGKGAEMSILSPRGHRICLLRLAEKRFLAHPTSKELKRGHDGVLSTSFCRKRYFGRLKFQFLCPPIFMSSVGGMAVRFAAETAALPAGPRRGEVVYFVWREMAVFSHGKRNTSNRTRPSFVYFVWPESGISAIQSINHQPPTPCPPKQAQRRGIDSPVYFVWRKNRFFGSSQLLALELHWLVESGQSLV